VREVPDQQDLTGRQKRRNTVREDVNIDLEAASLLVHALVQAMLPDEVAELYDMAASRPESKTGAALPRARSAGDGDDHVRRNGRRA